MTLRAIFSVRFFVATLVGGSLITVFACTNSHKLKQGRWLDSWANSHLSTAVTKNELQVQATIPEVLDHQTIRLVLWNQLAGDSVRVRITNQFGLKSLHINSARIAVHAGQGKIELETDRALTFDGKTSVSIPKGEEIWSDPVNLRVTAEQELAVSLYIATSFTPVQFHPVGLSTAYLSSNSGDKTAAEYFPKQSTTTMNFFVNNLQVNTTRDSSVIVALGDSITDGCCVAPDLRANWPDGLSKKLRRNIQNKQFSVINMGIGSNRFCASDGAGPSGLHRLEHDVLSRNGVDYVVIMEGINDISYEHISANALITCYKTAIVQARKAGIKVLMSPLLPIKYSVKDTPENELTRQAVNTWIRTTSLEMGGPDAVIDFESAVMSEEDKLMINKNFTTDFVHPNEKGYAAMVDAIDLTLFQ